MTPEIILNLALVIIILPMTALFCVGLFSFIQAIRKELKRP